MTVVQNSSPSVGFALGLKISKKDVWAKFVLHYFLLTDLQRTSSTHKFLSILSKIMSNRGKNIIVGIIALAVICFIAFLIWDWDRDVLATIHRGGYQFDTTTFRPTVDEIRIAKQFSDTILPQLKQLGLITQYHRSDMETIITVSGVLWNDRSAFFKESLLEQIFIYNNTNRYPVKTKIIENKTSRLVAEIVPPDQRTVY